MIEKYMCHNCGGTFEGHPFFMCGLEYTKKFKEGEHIADVIVYICEECVNKIEAKQ